MDLKWEERESFFTAVVRGLNQLMEDDDDITVELLREICYRYASHENWVRELFQIDKQVDDVWNRYLFLVQFSANDVEKLISSPKEADKELLSVLTCADFGDDLVAPIRGKPEVEGRILSQIYNFDLQIQGRIYDSSSSRDIILLKEKNNRFQIKNIFRKSNSFKTEHLADNKFFSSSATSAESTRLEEEDFVDSKPLSSPANLITDEKSVNERLNKFVLFFVNEFEEKLQSYIDIMSGKIDYKIDIFPNTFSSKVGHVGGGLFGGIVGGILGVLGVFGVETGAKVGADWGKELAQLISKIYMKEKTKSLWILIEEYRSNQLDFRQLLIEVGFDIFQSFEKQFMSVTSVSGLADEAMHLLARDAMNRVIYYVKSSESLSERGQLRSAVVNGVVLGKSKLDAKNLKMEGFQLTSGWKDDHQMWRTKCMYEQVGVVHQGKYYKAKSGSSNTTKYGHRKLFNHENMEKLEKQLRLEKDESSFSKYEYKVSLKKMKDFVDESLSRMMKEKLVLLLDKKRKREILEEAETDMEDVKIRLKEAMTKIKAEQLEKLFNFESTLDNLNFNQTVRKLDLHLDDDEARGSEIKELLEKNEELNRKLDEINTNVKLIMDKTLKR